MLRHLAAFVALGTLGLAGTACGGAPASDGAESSTSGLTQTVEESGVDAQVLQVWTPGRLFPAVAQGWQSPRPGDATIDADTACTTLETRGWSHWLDKTVDCEAAFASAAPFDLTHAPGPVMTPVHFTVSKDVNGGQLYVDPDFCSYLELRVVARDAATTQPSFAGIGFWTSRGEHFTPKGALQAVGQTRLANGEAATVFRFTGISTCISSAHSSTSGNMYQTFAFKPYAAYDAPDGNDTKRFRVWERIQGNHLIGRSWPGAQPAVDATSFDRQAELLAR
jgi:hypothetical protein